MSSPPATRSAAGTAPESGQEPVGGASLELLDSAEIFWRDHYLWLKDKGYELRPRYHPDWSPSWKRNGREPFYAEDALTLNLAKIMDAKRMEDGSYVVLKISDREEYPDEVALSIKFGAPDRNLGRASKNHFIPVIEVLPVMNEPQLSLIVMPLGRIFDNPRWDTVGEALDCIRQIFEGVLFLHDNHVAHRDVHAGNILMETRWMYPQSFHPHHLHIEKRRDLKGAAKFFTRTQRPPRYWLIDLGHARIYDPEGGPALDMPPLGGAKELPEGLRSDRRPSNPFATDVWNLGYWVQQRFMRRFVNFDFLEPLVHDLTIEYPDQRPTMTEVMERLDALIMSKTASELRTRPSLKRQRALHMAEIIEVVHHWRRRIWFTVTKTPPIPQRRSPSGADSGRARSPGPTTATMTAGGSAASAYPSRNPAEVTLPLSPAFSVTSNHATGHHPSIVSASEIPLPPSAASSAFPDLMSSDRPSSPPTSPKTPESFVNAPSS